MAIDEVAFGARAASAKINEVIEAVNDLTAAVVPSGSNAELQGTLYAPGGLITFDTAANDDNTFISVDPDGSMEIEVLGTNALYIGADVTVSSGLTVEDSFDGIYLGSPAEANIYVDEGNLTIEPGVGTEIKLTEGTFVDGYLETTGQMRPDTLKVFGNVGFYNTTPIAKPTVTGSRGGNAALASLLTALANLGLITNSTSA